MNIPKKLRAGDTWEWTESLSEYPASTYTLKYSFYRYGQSVITLTGTASGDDHAFSVAKATTAAYAAGKWMWTVYAEAAGERETVDNGELTILPDLAAASATTDLRTHAEKMVDAIRAVLEGRATSAQASMTFQGRAITYIPIKELHSILQTYEKVVRRESGIRSTILYQFGRS